MISAIEWVPAGVADPTPKKYEFSQAELDLIQMMEEHNMNDLDEVRAHLTKQKKQQRRRTTTTKRTKRNNFEER